MAICRSDIQLENAQVRVARWDIEPGASTGMHLHAYDYVVVPIVEGAMELTLADGHRSISTLNVGSSYFRPRGATHNARNVGEALLSFVEIELVSCND